MNIIKPEKSVLENCNMSVCEILYVCGSIDNVHVEKILQRHMMDSTDVNNETTLYNSTVQKESLYCLWSMKVYDSSHILSYCCNKQFSS
jgi:uncharacterized protein YccT (UPF0319 family)